MPWNTFYTGSEQEITIANTTIDSNCGFPDEYTTAWATPTKAYEQDFWFIPMPSPRGYKSRIKDLSQAQMIAGVVNVQQQESQSNWWPPYPPEGNK